MGDEVFLGALGQDFKIALPPEQVALLDFGALYPTLVDWTTNPADAGHEDIDGTDTVKVTGTVDAAKALTDLGPLLGVGKVAAAEAEKAVRTGTVEFWIGTEDLLPRRIHLVLDADGSAISSTVGAVNIDLTANLSAFGEPVDITAPEQRAAARPQQAGEPRRRVAAPEGRPPQPSMAPRRSTLRRSKSSSPSGSARNAWRISRPIGGLVSRRDSASTLAWLYLRAIRAVSASMHRAARAPGTLFAAIEAPVPDQQQTTARSQRALGHPARRGRARLHPLLVRRPRAGRAAPPRGPRRAGPPPARG